MQSPYHHVCLLLSMVSCKVLSCFILGSCVHPMCNQLWLLVRFLPCIYSSSYLLGLSPCRLTYICAVIMKFRIPTEKPAGCQWCCWSLGRQEGIRLVLWCQEWWWPLWWTIVFAAFILEVPVAFRYLTYLNVTDVQMEEENQIFGRKKRILTSVAIILNIWTTAATKKIACKGQNMTYLYVFNYSAFASSAPCILIWIFKYCYKHRALAG